MSRTTGAAVDTASPADGDGAEAPAAPLPCIAVVGAPRSGRTTLARALVEPLSALTGLHWTVWPGTPDALRRPGAAGPGDGPWLLDGPDVPTTAAAAGPTPTWALLTAPPDGPGAGAGERRRADDAVRAALMGCGWRWSSVDGPPDVRLQAALRALAPGLAAVLAMVDGTAPTPGDPPGPRPAAGLFTLLAARDAELPYAGGGWRWACDCDRPDCEHLLRRPTPR